MGNEYYTKEELKNIEKMYPDEMGRINWDKWDKAVERAKVQIQATKEEDAYKGKRHHNTVVRYVYNLQGQLVACGNPQEVEIQLKPYLPHLTYHCIRERCNVNNVLDNLYWTNRNYTKLKPNKLEKAIQEALERKQKK